MKVECLPILKKKVYEKTTPLIIIIFFFFHSVFYVFYEQYLTVWEDGINSMLISFLAIFVTSFVLLGLDLSGAFVIVITIAMILINLGGLMYWWDIGLNAVSLVNLVMVNRNESNERTNKQTNDLDLKTNKQIKND